MLQPLDEALQSQSSAMYNFNNICFCIETMTEYCLSWIEKVWIFNVDKDWK